jgi:hypothetical protein
VTALEATVAALEANAVPRSPNLAPNGQILDAGAFLQTPAVDTVLVCKQWDPTGGMLPGYAALVGLLGFYCEVAPPAGGGAP